MKKNYKAQYIYILFFVVTSFIKAQCTFTTVPYFESFSGISNNNQLPACWAASNLSNTCLTYTSVQSQNRVPCSTVGFASFSNTLGAHYFYSKGLYLNAGFTYSASLWYLTEYFGYTNWTDLSILYGSSQSSVALNSIVSSNGAAMSPACKQLSGTFTVASSGVYYMAIRATSNGTQGADYLSWDEFSVTVPCQLNGSSFSVTASSNTVCTGQSLTLTAIGNPGTTYTWSNGSTGSVIVVQPNANTTFSALGNNTVTACVQIKTISIQVKPIPIVSLFTLNSNICYGQSVTLIPIGGNTYSWSTGATSNSLIVSPSVTSTYTVTGTNINNCSSTAVQQINVIPLPNLTVTPSSTFACAGDELHVSFAGAQTYSWFSTVSSSSGTINPMVKQFAANENLVVTGTDQNGCSRTITLTLNVNECAGLNEKTLEKRLYVFPNPSNEMLNLIGLNNNSSIEMYDLKGQLVYTKNTNERRLTIDLKNFDKGLYVLQIVSGDEKVERKIIVE